MVLLAGAKQPRLAAWATGEERPESVKTNIETYFAPLLKTLAGLNVAQTLQGY